MAYVAWIKVRPVTSSERGNAMSRLCILFAAALLFVPMALCQQEGTTREAYTGVALGTGGPMGGRSIPFDLRINRYTTDEDVLQLAQLLKEKGQDALRRELEKRDVGRINAVGSTGNQIAVARKFKQGNQTIIRVFTARNMSFFELSRSGRSVDYPYGYLQLTLDENGKGVGQFIVAVKISFDKKQGKYEMESYGNQYVKAANVRPMK